MNPLIPEKLAEFRSACARLRNFAEFKIVIAYLEQRRRVYAQQLLISPDADQMRVLQGRVRELDDVLAEIHKQEV